MTIWILHMPLAESQEGDFTKYDSLPLPFGDVPDLSNVSNSSAFRHLVAALHPDMPPESLERIHNRVWKIFSELHPEDIIAVPLTHKRVVLLAEVSGKYRYDSAADTSPHRIPVKWQEKTLSFVRFRLHKNLLESSGWSMAEVSDQSARAIIQSSLPRRYNRFAGFKWIVVVFMLWNLVVMLVRR